MSINSGLHARTLVHADCVNRGTRVFTHCARLRQPAWLRQGRTYTGLRGAEDTSLSRFHHLARPPLELPECSRASNKRRRKISGYFERVLRFCLRSEIDFQSVRGASHGWKRRRITSPGTEVHGPLCPSGLSLSLSLPHAFSKNKFFDRNRRRSAAKSSESSGIQ